MKLQIQRRALGAMALGWMAGPARAKQLRLDERPPAELGHDLDGQAQKVEDGLGKLQLICFWASWCGYCKQLTPVLENLQRRIGPERMRTLLITGESRDQFRALARHARRELKLQFLHDRSGELSKQWGGDGFPYLVVVGPEGLVRESFSGYSERMLQPLLNEVNGVLRELAAVQQQAVETAP